MRIALKLFETRLDSLLVGLLDGAMPRRNTSARSEPGAYHVYNRGIDGLEIFRDDEDRREFLATLKRYLTAARAEDRRSRKCARVEGVDLLAYCLMTTHYHLILWQRNHSAMRQLMQRVVRSYSVYFNRRHDREGSMFAGVYRARLLADRKQFSWAVAYVHDNHPSGVGYEFSSHRAYTTEGERPAWLNTSASLRVFGGLDEYSGYIVKRQLRSRLNSEFF